MCRSDVPGDLAFIENAFQARPWLVLPFASSRTFDAAVPAWPTHLQHVVPCAASCLLGHEKLDCTFQPNAHRQLHSDNTCVRVPPTWCAPPRPCGASCPRTSLSSRSDRSPCSPGSRSFFERSKNHRLAVGSSLRTLCCPAFLVTPTRLLAQRRYLEWVDCTANFTSARWVSQKGLTMVFSRTDWVCSHT